MIRLIQGDALERLRELPAESVDLVLTDPPYGDTSLVWDRKVPGWPAAVRRLLKSHGSVWCFGSLRSHMAMARDGEWEGWKLAQDVIWEKHNGSGAFADRFRRVHEQAAQFYPADRRWGEVHKAPIFTNDATARTVHRKKRPPHWGEVGESSYASEDGGPRLQRSVFYARSAHGRAINETQKPVEILLPLIEYSCPPGGTVLDPFAGSGSTGDAAHIFGRDAILIELRPEMAESARKRLIKDAGLFARVA